MGNSTSFPRENTTNDIELVVRVTNELDHVLTNKFSAELARGALHHQRSQLQVLLGDKIQCLQNCDTVEYATIRQMKQLVQMRNQLVHDQGINNLRDVNMERKKYLQVYKEVRTELSRVIQERDNLSQDGGSCTIS